MPRTTKLTPEQDAFILEMRKAGMTYDWLAIRLNLTPQGVRWRWLNLTSTQPRPARQKPQWADRSCLTCDVIFKSEWCGHRICDGCKLTAAWQSGGDYACAIVEEEHAA